MMGEKPWLRRLDAAIIGGGLTGYLLGASLADAGMKAAVLELKGRMAAPEYEAASLQCAPMLARIAAVHGQDTARLHALHLQEQLHALTASPLPYVQIMPAVVFAQNTGELPLLTRQHTLLSASNLPAFITGDTGGCPFPVEQALAMPGQALVNLSRWMDALQISIRRKGGMVCEAIRHLALDGQQLQTEQGRITAQHIILTTDKPLGLRDRKLLAMLETRWLVQMNISGPLPLSGLQQSADGAFQLLPAGHGAAATLDAGRVGAAHQERRRRRLPELLSTLMPDWQQVGTQELTRVVPLDGLPFIGVLPRTGHLFVSGLGDCPVLGAMHAADVLTRRLLGQTRPEDRIYEPSRFVPGRMLNRAILRNALRYGAGIMRSNAPACPHCACRMRYYSPDQRWTCPFCGSIYTLFGEVLCGPAHQPVSAFIMKRPL